MQEGQLLWSPSQNSQSSSQLSAFAASLKISRGLELLDYESLYAWSVDSLEDFWESVWNFFEIDGTAYTSVLEARIMPNAKWFCGSSLNYAAHCLRHNSSQAAIIAANESGGDTKISWTELKAQVSSLAAYLRQIGVTRGDRVAAYIGNTPEAIVAFLATASLGAIWSSTSMEMGLGSVVDRFSQIEPKVLFAATNYSYNGKFFDRTSLVTDLETALPSVEKTIRLGSEFNLLLTQDAVLEFEAVPFDHPLYILYSSGTTGLPKPIVHGHGGILLEHYKQLGLQTDLSSNDRFFWFTTTGWMMWNYLVSGLLLGSSLVLWDGSPTHPNPDALWQLCERAKVTVFGCGAAFIHGNIKMGLEPAKTFDLSHLRAIGSTGSPLSLDGFKFVYEKVKPDIQLMSVSGGTDICSAFLGGSPWSAVYAGELSCRSLGAAVSSFDESGNALLETVGELVLTKPMPSMPVKFWNDPSNKRYLESYFADYPNVWRHGDWVKITHKGSAIIYGRSDATLNKGGVRMGTAEVYSVVERIPEILDSLIIDLEQLGKASFMPLFIVLRQGISLTSDLELRIKNAIRTELSPRLIPDKILVVPEIPRTLSGKKLELPIRKILLGANANKVLNVDALANPNSLEFFSRFAAGLRHNDV
jgi:acetoacetyl-CoA synthetase